MGQTGLPYLPLFVLCFARCAAMVGLSPPLSWRHFPLGLRLAVAAVLSVPLMLSLPATPAVPALGLYTLLLLREVGIGLLLGLGLWLLVQAGLAAGHLAETGLTETGDEEGPLATFLVLLIIVFFVQLNGLPWLVGALRESYSLLPLSTKLPELALWQATIYLPGRMLATMLALAAPVIVATALASWLVASVQRCLPSLQVAQLGPAVRHLAALLALVVAAPLVGAFVLGELNSVAATTAQALLRMGR